MANEQAILVTGGAGFVGQHVVRQLAERGRTVVALYHHKLPETLESVYPVCSDMSSAELMAAPLRGVETVVHLAWEGGLAGSAAPRNETLLKNLLLAMERAGTKRIVFLSANGATRNAAVPFLREKYQCEHLVLNSKVPEKVVLRTTVMWGGQGANDRFLRSIIRVMKYPLYPVPKRAEIVAPAHVRDVADMLVSACSVRLQEPAALLDVSGGESYQVQDLFKIVSDTYVKKTRIALPSFLGEPLLPFLERDRRVDQPLPKLAHFLAIGGKPREETKTANALTAVIPPKLATFKERILD